MHVFFSSFWLQFEKSYNHKNTKTQEKYDDKSQIFHNLGGKASIFSSHPLHITDTTCHLILREAHLSASHPSKLIPLASLSQN